MNATLRERALRLLARREYARAELARKLAAHVESAEELESLLDDLSERGLLSDERYVEMRLNARSARYGNARLAQELRSIGIGAELVDGALTTVEDELSRAKQVWQRKYGDSRAAAEPAERARQAGFLMRRGFSGETIRCVLRGGHEND